MSTHNTPPEHTHPPVPHDIQRLVEQFALHIEEYKKGTYDGTQVRRDYIDPFFKALGWDVDNEQGYAEHYREVIHEDKIKIGSHTKAPDYSFRIGGVRKFFVEAKRPAVSLKDEIDPSLQIRRYGWNAKLSLCVLTDFEEFAIYDTRIKPKANDKPSTARLFYCTYTEYQQKWQEIAHIFAKEAILKGSFDKYAQAGKRKGADTVDDEFLRDVEKWREILAKNIIKNNQISQRELNFAVQKIIDRIIFLRICEDRHIEDEDALKKIATKDIYQNLLRRFLDADNKYNSGLFHFNKEKGRKGDVDTLTPQMTIDDKPLKEIILSLYYPCPYEFSVMPADILGSVYERFLGKTVNLSATGKSIQVEEKPEVRKVVGNK